MENGRDVVVDRVKRGMRFGLAGIGIVALVLLNLGLWLDYRNFDRTSGGYDPPYTNYSGTTIDWDAAYVSSEGMVRTGYVLNTFVNCTSGMVSFEAYGQKIDWRQLSPRAIAIHQPREACIERGFNPEF